MKVPKVENMVSNSGNAIPNQYILALDNCTIFRSYDTAIAVKFNDGTIVLSDDWDYSSTTSKYRNIFLDETTAETRRNIDNDTYRVLSDKRLGVLINEYN